MYGAYMLSQNNARIVQHFEPAMAVSHKYLAYRSSSFLLVLASGRYRIEIDVFVKSQISVYAFC